MRRHALATQLTVVVLAAGTLIASLLAHQVLPEQFLRDDQTLQQAMDPSTSYLLADSFQAIGRFYAALGLQDAPPLASLLGVLAFLVGLFVAIGWNRMGQAGPWQLAFMALWMGIAVVYLGQYSKEIVTLGVCLLVLIMPRGRGWDVVIVAAMAAYGATLRPYWLIVAPLYLVLRYALHRVRHTRLLLLIPVLFYAAAQPAFQLVLHAGMQSQRDEVNEVRDGLEPVATLIVSPLPDGPGLQGIVAILLMFLLFLVPVPLLALGSPYYIASGAVIVLLWAVVLTQVFRGRLTGSAAPQAPAHLVKAGRAAAALLALVMVQTFFEPDYGSCLKHLAPVLPLAMALLPCALGTRALGTRAQSVPVQALPDAAGQGAAEGAPAVVVAAGPLSTTTPVTSRVKTAAKTSVKEGRLA